MTGPEHYKEAERLLKAATDFMEAQAPQIMTVQQQDAIQQGVGHLMARAQVHATLAQTAAFVDANLKGSGSLGVPEFPRWVKAVSS